MTDYEISRRLALAIGWKDDPDDPDVVIFLEDFGRAPRCAVWFELEWHTFDYRDPAVIWPIAERFNCFPTFHAVSDTWSVGLGQWMAHEDTDTAAKAVALAVIKAKEKE